MKDKKGLKRKLAYGFFTLCLAGMYASYVPVLMDYYTVRPGVSFPEFYQSSTVEPLYTFEAVAVAVLLGILYSATTHAGVSVLLTSLLLFSLTHASYLKYLNRRELLKLEDFRLTEAAGMALQYIRFEPDGFLFLFAGVLLGFTALAFLAEAVRAAAAKTDGENKASGRNGSSPFRLRCRRLAVRLGCILALCVFFACYGRGFLASRLQLDEVDAVNPTQTEKNRFVLYQFLRDDTLQSFDVRDVEESSAFLKRKGEEYASKVCAGEGVWEQGDAARPNIIVIMNESWWNTDNLDPGYITFSKDPMEPFKELEAECSSGYLTTNVYGGGTVSSEAEFLTGLNTKYYVGSSGVYSRTLDRKLPTVVDYFNALDYDTVAIHPYYGEFYSRRQVYDNMGFDRTVFAEDMSHDGLYTHYISDEALAEQIIEEYENGEGENRFIWAVSVANHGLNLEYPKGNLNNLTQEYDYPISVSTRKQLSRADETALVNYVNGIYLAGEAYRMLVEYFSRKEEPVILLMYGDHMPNFSSGILEAVGMDAAEEELNARGTFLVDWEQKLPGEGSAGLSENDPPDASGGEEIPQRLSSDELLRRLYSVPVLMWSSRSEEPFRFAGEGIYYLPQILLERAGLPDAGMTQILRYERSLFRANARAFVLDGEGKALVECTGEQAEALNHFKIMEYDILLGEGICRDIWLPLQEK